VESNRAEQDEATVQADQPEQTVGGTSENEPLSEDAEQTAAGDEHNGVPAVDNVGKSEENAGKAEENVGKVEIEAYWIERKRYLQEIRQIPELRRKYVKSALAYLIRRFLWSFTFFPVFIAFWVPLVLNRFNLVATIKNILPSLQTFVNANPQSQAATVETLFIAWFSIGITFAIFDFILTPFKDPYAYEADVHMRSWEELHLRNKL
jgi:hypothetical protein